ncbi:MAG: MFS transporter [Candidatus Aminicenantes bacterium]|nr:MFS transporter [Candidatus Aminicenantes bacterium]
MKPIKLWNKNFFLLWQGQFVSQLGNQAFSIAMVFWIKHQTGSASLMGLLMMLIHLPMVILGPVAGTIADSYSRRRIIIACDVLAGVPVIILAMLIFFAPQQTSLILVLMLIVGLLLGAVRTFFNPAITAAIPDIVPEEKIAAANSLNQSSVQISTIFGQGLGGYLFMLLGAPLLILINGITYLFSAFSESFISIPQGLPEKSRIWKEKFAQFKKDTLEGLKIVWRNTGMRSMFFVAAFLNFFIMPLIVLLPFYVEDFLGVTPDWYGYLLAGFGFGALIGYGFAATLKLSGKRRSRSVILAMILMTILLASLSVANKSILSLAIWVGIGIANGFININIITLLQTSVPSELRGRIFGLLTTITAGLTPLGLGLGGVVADLTGRNIPLIYGVCGIVLILLSITIALLRPFRRFLSDGTIEIK